MSFLWTRRGLWNRAAVLICALAMLAFLSPRAMAQAVSVVEVDGHVTDPTGQVIVGAATRTGTRPLGADDLLDLANGLEGVEVGLVVGVVDERRLVRLARR